MRNVIALVVSLAIVYAVAAGGAMFTGAGVREWYPTLAKPSFTPPSWLFGPVWTLLYTLMAIAAWLVWRRAGQAHVALPLALFAVQLVLNFAWSWLFFGLRRPDLGLADIVLLWVAILGTMIAFWRVSTVAGVLFIPYLLWVSLATALNYSLWKLNP